MGGKLVRDNIPDVIFADTGVFPSLEVLDSLDNFSAALRAKLLEEAHEAAAAESELELIEEIADIEEVICALLELYDIPREAVKQARKIKRDSRGGFGKRLFLVVD